MSTDAEAIENYIAANRGTYTDQAIRENLAAAGHQPAAIDEAFAQLGLVPPPAQLGKPSTGLVTLAWILFVLGGLIGLAGFGMGGYFVAGASVPIFLLVFGGVGMALIVALRWAIPRFGIRGGGAFLVGLALGPAYFLLLYGSCAAAFTTRT